jgi:protoheme IX farnesyltransferase
LHTSNFRVLYVLTRFPVSLAVTFTAFAAMIISAGQVNFQMLLPVAGIFLLASGASAFNQYQEWPYDERMERTRKRPVPSRTISTAEALRIAMICIVGGIFVLLYYSTVMCTFLGIINLIWYNGVYTYLKRKTAFAVVPGALTGAVPILMGWTAAGGSLLAPEVIFLAFFIFIWQMPHFWMLTLKYGDQYRHAGFPVLTDYLSHRQVKIVTMAWMVASSATACMIVFFRILHTPLLGYTIIVLNCVLLLVIAWQLFLAKIIRYRLIFIAANVFMLIMLAGLVADSLLKG